MERNERERNEPLENVPSAPPQMPARAEKPSAKFNGDLLPLRCGVPKRYYILSALIVGGLVYVNYASLQGPGLDSDSQALARARGTSSGGGSVRGGSLHRRNFNGGGPGFGK